MLTRRKLIGRTTALMASGAAGKAGAQSPTRPRRVAYVWLFSAGPSAPHPEAFRARMAELGWNEGREVTLTYHDAKGDPQLLASIAAQLVKDKVDVIVATCTPEAKAARALTSTIPIVMTSTGDPVEAGLVESLARPGGNITGVSTMSLHLSAKRIALLKEALPALTRATVIWNPGRPDSKAEVQAMTTAAARLGVKLRSAEVRTVEELDRELEFLGADGAQALLNAGDSLVTSSARRITARAAALKLPSLFEDRIFVDAGGLMSYGPNFVQLHRRAADYVDRILKGARPGDLPIEQPTSFELIVSRKVANALGIVLPRSLLLQADEVIG
jgi:putative tryptophan/tyrosine transport system substrate-binding protein